jgi:[ribosomal protein S5]-alanine N-acetyltransferase
MKLERKGKKVIVRPYEAGDYQAWKESYLLILPKPKNIWDVTAPRDKSELTQKHFNKILRSQKKNRDDDYYFDFGVFLKDGTLVGGVSIMDISRQVFQNAYLGYKIHNNHWGKGYGKEGVKLGIEIAFKELKLHRLEAGIEPSNKRSIALAKAIGMRREGYSKKRLFLRNQWLDMVLYVVRCEELGIPWNPKNSKRIVRF